MLKIISKNQSLIILSLILGLTVSFYLGRYPKIHSYQEIIEAAHQLSQHESSLAQQILNVRYGAFSEYDFIHSEMQQLHLHSSNLRNIIRNELVDRGIYSEIDVHLNNLILDKQAGSEAFEFRHKEITDTLSRITLLKNELAESRLKPGQQIITDIERLIVKANNFPVTEIGRNILLIKKDIQLVETSLKDSGFDKHLILFSKNSELLIKNLRVLAKLQAKLLNKEISEHIFELLGDFSSKEMELSRAENNFYILGYVVALFLLIYSGYLFVKVRQKNMTLEIANNNLLSEKSKMLSTLSSLSDGIVKISPSGHVLYMNAVAERMTDHLENESIGQSLKKVLQVYDASSGELVEDVIRECTSRSSMHEQHKNYLVRGKNDKERIVELNYVPVEGQDHTAENFVLIMHDVSENHHLIEHMLYQANHDSLTGLLNRTEFEREVLETITKAKDTDATHILLYIDIDQFKLINDTSGHLVGDELLRRVALILEQFVGEAGIVSRLGGDEFGILYKDRLLSEVVVFASDLLEKIKGDRFQWKDCKHEVSVSIGIVEINPFTAGLREVLAQADIAVYTAKDLGRNRAHIFVENDVVLAKRHQELTWAASITEALDDDRFSLYCQKIQTIKSEEDSLDKVEILVRLIDENGKEISPGAFIPAAERYNMMGAIDRWVVKHSLEILNELQSAHGANTYQFCVNLSGNSLSDQGFLDFVISALSHYPVELNSLCFEITETAAISNLADATYLISELQDRGILFALDDFGSGLSSFSYLKNLSVDFLKIDGSFVKNMVGDREDYAMVEAINQVGHVMGMQTVAEFVENDEILTKLIEIGVDYAQGYGIARPEPLSNLLLQFKEPLCEQASTNISD